MNCPTCGAPQKRETEKRHVRGPVLRSVTDEELIAEFWYRFGDKDAT